MSFSVFIRKVLADEEQGTSAPHAGFCAEVEARKGSQSQRPKDIASIPSEKRTQAYIYSQRAQVVSDVPSPSHSSADPPLNRIRDHVLQRTITSPITDTEAPIPLAAKT